MWAQQLLGKKIIHIITNKIKSTKDKNQRKIEVEIVIQHVRQTGVETSNKISYKCNELTQKQEANTKNKKKITN